MPSRSGSMMSSTIKPNVWFSASQRFVPVLHPVYCIAFCRESVLDMLADFPIVLSKEDFHRTLALKNVAPTDRNPTPKEWQFQMPG